MEGEITQQNQLERNKNSETGRDRKSFSNGDGRRECVEATIRYPGWRRCW